MKRNPWPYAIVIYFAVFISAMIAWICFAVRHDQELVRKDYYEQEMQFQNEIDRVARTRPLNVHVFYDAAKNAVKVELPGDAATATIHFYRPASSALDRKFTLSLEQGAQTIDVQEFQAGLWKVRLAWMANGNEYRHDQTLVFAPLKLSAL